MRSAAVTAALFLSSLASATGETSTAKLRKIDVAVEDARGQPVTGLRNADFELFEDGKRQDIVFSRFTGGRRGQAAAARVVFSNDAEGDRHGTVILLDLLTERGVLSDSVIGHQLSLALKKLASGEGLYLYLLDAFGVLHQVHGLPPLDTGAPPPETEVWTRNAVPLIQAALKQLVGLKPVDDQDLKHRFDLSVGALRELGSRMMELPGRKNLVWLTRGVPIVGYSISTQSGLDFTNPLHWLCAQLELSQIAVYTVYQSTGAVGTPSAQFLEEFADLTGGREYSSNRAGDAIEQAIADSCANYQIAYYPGAADSDGKFHKIRVACSRKNVRLQSEHGFYGVSLNPLAPGILHARDLAMDVDTAAHSPFDATDISLSASESPDPAHAGVKSLEIHVDGKDLLPRTALRPDAGGVFVVFAAYDQGWKQPTAPIVDHLVPSQLAAAGQGEIVLRYAIPLGPTIRNLRAIVYDAELRATGSVTIPIRP